MIGMFMITVTIIIALLSVCFCCDNLNYYLEYKMLNLDVLDEWLVFNHMVIKFYAIANWNLDDMDVGDVTYYLTHCEFTNFCFLLIY